MDESSEGPLSRAFCLFQSESRPLGVVLEVVAEVMEAGRLVWLPLCPRQVVGLCTYRSKIVPVIRPSDPDRPPAYGLGGDGRERAVMILRTGNGLWGLSIDRGGVSVEVARESPADGGGTMALARGIVASGTVDREGMSHTILDHDRTWRALKTEIDHWYADALGSEGSGLPSVSMSASASALGRFGAIANSEALQTRRIES
jgi:chemotaxis signal transduction protein